MVKAILKSKVFRYFISAGIATWVDITVYFVAFNYIYQKSNIDLFGLYTVSAPTASLILSYTMGLITNFLITKFLVFNESELATHQQLVALFILVLNYFFMHFLINNFGWYPTIARGTSAITIGMLSFLIHKSFSFKVGQKTKA